MPSQFPQNAEYGGLVSGMSNNHPEAFNSEGYNTFDRSALTLQTQRFADINPIYSKKFISGDIVPIQSDHKIRTFTLSSPLLTDVYMHRSFYSVPLQCIYPNTFQVFFKPQIKGNELPAGAKPKMPLAYIKGSTTSIAYFLGSEDGTGSGAQSEVIWMNLLFLLIQIWSQDGLLAKLGYGHKSDGIDDIVDYLLTTNSNVTFQFYRPSDNKTYAVNFADTTLPLKTRRFLLLQLINNKYILQGVTAASADWANFVTDIRYMDFFTTTWSLDTSLDCVNLEKVIAYQLVCAQFFTNSYVDDINTAKKWLDNEMALLDELRGAGLLTETFLLNGVKYRYDLVSQQTLHDVFKVAATGSGLGAAQISIRQCAIDILRNIFEIQESLKTSDYFVDSRTQPLAVGDVYSAVVSNQVSAIDINKSLWMQRLLNAVNRIPDNIVEYLRKMFGNDPTSKEPQPMFISSERFLLGGQEVENTSDTNQGNTVTLLRSEDSRYRFEFKLSEPSVVIGLNSFSVGYVYAHAMDKEFTEFDRYDNFNPYLQHIGDQPVTQQELVNDLHSATHLNNFGYQLRYAQYKTAISHCSGAFSDDRLPSWASIYDKSNSAEFKVLNPEFIRNANIDFDDFYSSLTGTRLTDYFHFICAFNTNCFVNSKQQKFPSLV